MKIHYVDVLSIDADAVEGFDVGICGSEFNNYHDCRAVPLSGQPRRFFDASDGVNCRRCLKILGDMSREVVSTVSRAPQPQRT
jgi:hypothetical protein